MTKVAVEAKWMGLYATNEADDPRGYIKVDSDTSLKLGTSDWQPNVVNISRDNENYEHDLLGDVDHKLAPILFGILKMNTTI